MYLDVMMCAAKKSKLSVDFCVKKIQKTVISEKMFHCHGQSRAYHTTTLKLTTHWRRRNNSENIKTKAECWQVSHND
jgi:hypothetical protein